MLQKSIFFDDLRQVPFREKATANETLSFANVSNYPLTCHMYILVSAFQQSLVYEKVRTYEQSERLQYPQLSEQQKLSTCSKSIQTGHPYTSFRMRASARTSKVFGATFCHSAITSCYLTINQDIALWQQKLFCCHNVAMLLPYLCNQDSVSHPYTLLRNLSYEEDNWHLYCSCFAT